MFYETDFPARRAAAAMLRRRVHIFVRLRRSPDAELRSFHGGCNHRANDNHHANDNRRANDSRRANDGHIDNRGCFNARGGAFYDYAAVYALLGTALDGGDILTLAEHLRSKDTLAVKETSYDAVTKILRIDYQLQLARDGAGRLSAPPCFSPNLRQ